MSNPETKPVQGGGAFVVAPNNIGKGIIWNDNTKTYEVNIGNGLEINSEGKVVVQKLITNPEATKIVDNGTATVIGQQYTIDYGNGLIEVNGILEFPLATVPNSGSYGAFPITIGRFGAGCSSRPMNYADQADLYHKESVTVITAEELGMSKILNISSMPCDIDGYRTESVWIVQEGIFADYVKFGVKTLARLEQDKILTVFQVKGIKA